MQWNTEARQNLLRLCFGVARRRLGYEQHKPFGGALMEEMMAV
jgi:hypothetical protein